MFVLLRVLVLLAVTAATAARADEPSTTPYAALYKVLEPAQQMARYDRLRAVQRIQSKLSTVSASQIRIVIKASRGDIVVPISADGRIEFPFDGALKGENPPVQTNQPKGSLSLTVTMELKLPPGERIAWRDLDAALAQARAVLDEQARGEGTAVPSVGGAEFRFAPGGDARVTLTGKSERLLVADAQGRVIVMLDEPTLKEQPDLLLNARPLEIVPFLSASAAK